LFQQKQSGLGQRFCAHRKSASRAKIERMNSALRTVILVLVILLLIGSLPTWGYSGGWGYGPSGGLGLVLVVLVVLLLLGKI
jgi:hypothetical protein